MTELNIQLSDILTPRTCSVAIAHIIQYIAYNFHQIPYNYIGLSNLVRKGKNFEQKKECEGSLNNRSHKLASHFYNKVKTTFEKFEASFQHIEEELSSFPGIKEIVIILGSSLNTPKHIYRIEIPSLAFGHSSTEHSSRKMLDTLCRTIITSESFNKPFDVHIEPTNMYIMLNMREGTSPKTDWFLPKDNFSIPAVAEKTVLKFQLPSEFSCSCDLQFIHPGTHNYEISNFNVFADPINSFEIVSSTVNKNLHDRLTTKDSKNSNFDSNCKSHPVKSEPGIIHNNIDSADFCTTWYILNEILQGFKDCKIGGSSVYNILSK